MAHRIILETKRLILREAELTDHAFFLNLLNTPKWKHYIGDRGIKTNADSKTYIKDSLIQSYRVNGFGFYIMILKVSESEKVNRFQVVESEAVDEDTRYLTLELMTDPLK